MKKIFTFLCICLFAGMSVWAQNTPDDLRNEARDFLYINTWLDSKDAINELSLGFSVDGYTRDERTGMYKVRVALGRHEYEGFLARQLPFEIITPERPPSSMVTTDINDFTTNWNKYPSYAVYVQLMQNFAAQHPDICRLDTILEDTPHSNHHSILAVHISNTLGQATDKPAFLYTSTMHGDEVVCYYMMLRLIDYILNNPTDPAVAAVLNNIDLWICPLENPDGTYYTSDTQISSNYSRRYNYNNVDMNRNYPFLPGVSGSANVQPESQAYMDWVADKHFVMSANFHGGAELTNYPWDSWTSAQRSHPDANWFQYVCQNYVDACQAVDPTYMVGETAYQPGCGSVTEGGDWYVITGSRQDYMNYYQHCREVTIEAHFDKVCTSSSELPTYWTNSKDALLGYIMESSYGFRGIVTDAVTGDPIDEAKIWVVGHDDFNSEVYSHLPLGTYYRPIKAGSYTVEVSADCYETQTFNITTTDGAGLRLDVQLQPLVSAPQVSDQHIMAGQTATLISSSANTRWYASATATTPLATGATFTTPVLTQTTAYYASERVISGNVVCESERTEAIVFVNEVELDTAYGHLTVESCGPYEINGQTLTISGCYSFFFPHGAYNYADSILLLNLIVHPTYEIDVTANYVVGDIFYIGSDLHIATQVGAFTYTYTYPSVFGCDSTVNYTCIVAPSDVVYGEIYLDGCSPFIYEGEVLINDGDYIFTYEGAGSYGEDSILLVHLTLHPSYDITIDTSLAIGEHLLIGDYDFYALEDDIYTIDKELTSEFGCDSMVHYRIAVGNVGIGENEIGLTVFPNPVHSQCTVTLNGTANEIRVYDMHGKLVETYPVESRRSVINMEGWTAGLYLIEVRGEGERMTKKVIKL